jgi:glycosyltransferase involved in cell wall biosynthesis
VVTGTFHNPGWYLSHVIPLTRSGVEEVILVVDEPQMPIEKVRFVCPPRWVAKVLSRAVAKALWMVVAGLRYKPDLYMGYHILPGACSALIAARLFGRPACYQMLGDPNGAIGGSFHAERRPTRGLSQISVYLEQMAMAVVRQFELVVVRGRRAKAFLAERGIDSTVAIITGSVRSQSPTRTERSFDLAFVGRMAEEKQPLQFIEITAAVRRTVPEIRAVMLGEGPLMEDVHRKADELHVADCIDILGKRNDVEAFLVASKVFVLTSQSEGMSIAMLEAMAAGAVPVVANVGELGDLVENGINGFLVEPDNLDQYAAQIVTLLSEPEGWLRCSAAAREAADRACNVNVVSELWQHNLGGVIERAAHRAAT